jgi:SAM-dependent methyltransferase
MRLQPLDAAFGVDRTAVERLFGDFVARSPAADDPEWNEDMRRRRRKILKRALRRILLGWLPDTKRTEQIVREEYTGAWQSIDFATYATGAPRDDYTPWEWDGKRLLASDVGATRVRQLLLIRVIERLQPRRVLEVGCGNGINLVLLACRFPDIEFSGVELTEAGHRAATEFQRRPALPEPLQRYAPEPLADPAGFRRISFLQGNAMALPFADGAFDLVYSTLALEQMEQIRDRALAEMARVTRRHTLMVEPFADVNRSLWPRLNVLRRNYFRGAIADLPRHGLRPLAASRDFPQEAFLKVCAVLAEKSPGGRP